MSFLDSREQLSPQGIGKSVPRREDARLLMGRGRYANDFSLPGQAYAYILRSPHAHARIAGIDVAAAVDAPGVLAVLTGRDAAADGLRPIPHSPVPSNPHEVPLSRAFGVSSATWWQAGAIGLDELGPLQGPSAPTSEGEGH